MQGALDAELLAILVQTGLYVSVKIPNAKIAVSQKQSSMLSENLAKRSPVIDVVRI